MSLPHRIVFRALPLALLGIVLASTRPAHVASAQHGGGGTIRGRITVTKEESGDDDLKHYLLLDRYATNKSPQSEVLVNPRARDPYRLPEKAVVYLESEKIGRSGATPPSKHAVLDQRDLMFRPQVLPILLGTAVDFPNRDKVFHNVFSYSEAREFDLGRYPRGDFRTVTFNEAGVVRVYCDIHAYMNATILVFAHPFFTVPADDGTYAIAGVPDGTYTLVFWYGRDVADRRRVTVRGGETVTEDFRY